MFFIFMLSLSPLIQGKVFGASLAAHCVAADVCTLDCPEKHFLTPAAPDPAPHLTPHCDVCPSAVQP